MPFPYTQQVWADADASKPLSAARMGVLEAGIALAGVVGTSSSPPGSPTDGMIWRCPANASAGVYWFFQYDSSQATNKWVFMGGPPLYAEVATAESTSSTTYAALATAGPSLVIPRSGDYLVTQAMIVQNNGAAGTDSFMSYDIGGTGAVDADAARTANAVVTVNNLQDAYRKRLKALTAVTLTSKYRVSAGTGSFWFRSIEVLPIRVI